MFICLISIRAFSKKTCHLYILNYSLLLNKNHPGKRSGFFMCLAIHYCQLSTTKHLPINYFSFSNGHAIIPPSNTFTLV